MLKAIYAILATSLVLLTPGFAASQTATIPLWPGAAPGTEGWTQEEITVTNTPIGTVILNVVNPTLTAYLPEPSKATGTGIIIAPGGYCVALAMDVEGRELARSLQAHGIAAFILKYRIIEKKQQGPPTNIDMDEACKYGMADGIRAVAVVRAHASQWHVLANKVGFIGFSAGGMIASAALLQPDASRRPNFAAFVYGPPFGVMPAIPQKLPPIFMAWAQNDNIAGDAVAKFYDALRSSGNRPEAHIFTSGGHGFGTKKQGTTSDYWVNEFYCWIRAAGFSR
ncbi:MAG: alpha/beta hydrolase [Candidatus Eremiobacteraeota bacterium]|nr:alpha/beta hydrolase [Candidatus Eremiobacteraeota bacterium]